jgi:glutathionylspermidine synthase
MLGLEAAQAALKRTTTILPRNHRDADWLDDSRPSCQVFIHKYGRSLVAHPDQASASYFTMDAWLQAELARITTELHGMFVKATEHVCKNPELWPDFGFPAQYWPRALASFYQADKVLCGRFDLSVTPEYGIKVLEYNADSASCLFECGYSQEAWAKAAGVHEGVSGGIETERHLVQAWQALNLPRGTLVHFLHDMEDEEQYHALYMMEMASKAGFRTRVYHDISEFRFGENGSILDSEKEPVKYVWKTWSYSTLLSLWRPGGGSGGKGGGAGEVAEGGGEERELSSGNHVRLVDVCLNDSIVVFEPWWAAIPANKAILPVLNHLFPGHPNLLTTSWTLTEQLKANGYAVKPILGRCGENVALHASLAVAGQAGPGHALERKGGRFESNPCVYQELCTLPLVGSDYVQVNTWAVAGVYAGTVLRVDKNAILSYDSEAVALRIVTDSTSAALPTMADEPGHAQAAIYNDREEEEEDDEEEKEVVARTSAAGKMSLPFGAVLGFALGGIAAYSCDYNTADKSVHSSRVAYRHQANGLYYGFKFQCVEFSRRWLIHVMGLTYGDIGMAYEIFLLREAIRVQNVSETVPWTNIENGQTERPQVGSLLIWNEGGEFRVTGHVAVVVAVTESYVRVAEQNVDDCSWQHVLKSPLYSDCI